MSAKIIRFPIRSENPQISIDPSIHVVAAEETGYGLSLSVYRLLRPKLQAWGQALIAFFQPSPSKSFGNTQF